MRCKSWIAIAIGLALFACSPAPEVPPGRVELYLTAPPDTGFATGDGHLISLAQANLVVSAVELVECPSPKAFRPRLISSAHAHSDSGPTRLGEPQVVDLLAAGEGGSRLGELSPPPGRYCTLRVTLGPADEDAKGLPSAFDLVGTTARVEGTRRAPSAAAEEPLLVRSGLTGLLTLELGGGGLQVQSGASSRLQLAAAHPLWLDGLDFAGEAVELRRAFFENVKRSVSVRQVP